MLPVETAKNFGPDDFLYAPTGDAYVDSRGNPQSHVLRISGNFPNRCLRIREVKVAYYSDVIVVQPIMDQSGRACTERSTPFNYSVALDATLRGRYLLHVRSMNGQAVNKLVDLR